MNRRDALTTFVSGSAGLTGLLAVHQKLQAETVPEILSERKLRTDGFYFRRMQEIMRYVRGVTQGLYSGWGLAIHELARDEVDYPLPTQPERTHASWPYLHCLCHCTAAAAIDHNREEMSMHGGVGDELYQALSANLFPTMMYPMIYLDVAARSGRTGIEGAEQTDSDMVVIMNYLFGDDTLRKRSLFMAGLRNRESRVRLKILRDMMYPLIDALESAWQRSDFLDNATGRQGGCQCPKDLPPAERVQWCRKWCQGKGIRTDTPEGPETDRPWGPYHPLDPGPIPTHHETIYGGLKPLKDAALAKPHPLYAPLAKVVKPDIRNFTVVSR